MRASAAQVGVRDRWRIIAPPLIESVAALAKARACSAQRPGSSAVPTVERDAKFPLFALVLGSVGSVCLLFGLLGQFSPEAVSFMPALRDSAVSVGLIMIGVFSIVFELASITQWIRHRSKQSRRL
ncbi:MAG: hypothetical protein ACI8W7_002688 [Gammaproteobacteria bacterium]|jgi:hypothetical protein